MKRNTKYKIGIDLGTTYSSVAIYRNNRAEILNNNNSHPITPSCVLFNDSEVITGDEAKGMGYDLPNNLIYDSKRMIGLTFDKIKNELSSWPFKVISNNEGYPMIEVSFEGEVKRYSPQKISSYILREMKHMATDFLSTDNIEAVITVPADFNAQQRKFTRIAAELAELKVIRIIDEPTAAAIAYGYDNNIDTQTMALVFDFGGGTLDVSLLEIITKKYTVLATAGDPHLGGQDIDNNLFNYVADCFQQLKQCDLRGNSRSRSILRNECEKAKITLTKSKSANISCASLYNGIDFTMKITREKFEEINSEIFERMLLPIHKVLDDMKLTKDKIDSVILVGGTSKIPSVIKRLEDFFGKDKIKRGVDAQTAVTIGATILANNEHIIESVLSHSLGVMVDNGKMETIIPRNTKIPTKVSKKFTTVKNNQPKIVVGVYMGEEEEVVKNTFLGAFTLVGIMNAENGVPQINVTFEINEEGIVSVSAEDQNTGASNKIDLESIVK
ncbi:cytoplasmic heat shock protein 70 [Histomonas meleagridis]|uniref:cytoplasmic heat shock protein 70 n=1 Tax=Histomonas meleagridis TaxID=135588 RepID=UPI0035598AFC|nr:cytoplasmic heat shock protein 70 [Histomonas meleagridis]KAH0796987.1 cytoplasmic heat shock protein 70 [Histomonas meleagridis]